MSDKPTLSERMPTWALITAALFSSACQAELTRRNKLFKSQVIRLHKHGAPYNALLGSIAYLYRLGALVILGCLAIMCIEGDRRRRPHLFKLIGGSRSQEIELIAGSMLTPRDQTEESGRGVILSPLIPGKVGVKVALFS